MAVEGAFSPEFNWAFAYEIGAFGPEIRCEPDYSVNTGVHWGIAWIDGALHSPSAC